MRDWNGYHAFGVGLCKLVCYLTQYQKEAKGLGVIWLGGGKVDWRFGFECEAEKGCT